MFNGNIEVVEMASSKKKELKFMDFCAGIGGGRLGLEKAGMRCVGFSEIGRDFAETYFVI